MLVFAIDPGTNSAGWAVFDLCERQDQGRPAELVAAGVRLFAPSAVRKNDRERSLTVRHRHRRRLRTRRNRLVSLLTEAGLLPADSVERQLLFELDPWEIRARGLREPLSDHEFGRTICHIAKRRGLANDQSHHPLPASAHGHPTWGAWLWSRHAGPAHLRLPVRNRLSDSAAIQTDLAPPRRALEHEFDTLWAIQTLLRKNGLPAVLAGRIREILFGNGRSALSRPSMPAFPGPLDPLVRIASNQVCRLVKAMVTAFGQPGLVAIERFSPMSKFRTRVASSYRNGDEIAHESDSKRSRKRLSLLRRQERAAGGRAFCPYTGVQLDRTLALSSHVQIDHIVPVSRFGGDHPDNLVLCIADANRAKAARTPREAFGSDDRWRQILNRAHKLPAGNRVCLLKPQESSCPQQEFDRRQPHSMRQIVKRIARTIEDCSPSAAIELVDPGAVAAARQRHSPAEHLLPTMSGKVKDRLDHRHHAMDAIATGLTAISARYGEARAAVKHQNIASAFQSVSVSVRPRHGMSGPLHKQTIYGRGDRADMAVYRKPLAQLTLKDFGAIRDAQLRTTLKAVVNGQDAAGRRKLLAAFSARTGIRRVRLVRNLASGIPLADKATGKLSRIVQPLANHHMDVVCDREGAWHAFGATTHAVRQRGWRPEWEEPGCGLKLVMRLHKGDAIEIDGDGGKRIIRRVVRLTPSGGRVYLACPNAAGNLAARHADPGDTFRWEILSARELCRRRARAVRIDILGRRSYRKSNIGT